MNLPRCRKYFSSASVRRNAWPSRDQGDLAGDHRGGPLVSGRQRGSNAQSIASARWAPVGTIATGRSLPPKLWLLVLLYRATRGAGSWLNAMTAGWGHGTYCARAQRNHLLSTDFAPAAMCLSQTPGGGGPSVAGAVGGDAAMAVGVPAGAVLCCWPVGAGGASGSRICKSTLMTLHYVHPCFAAIGGAPSGQCSSHQAMLALSALRPLFFG